MIGHRSTAVFASVCAALACVPAFAQANRGTEYRSLNTDVYHIEIQKNGEIDVLLGGVAPSMFDVFPMVWFDGEREPERIRTDGRWTQRYGVEDRLGDGQGMVQQYRQLEWSLRAYPTRTFFAVQAAYTNDSKKAVTVRAILPWCIGDPRRGAFTLGEGTDTSVILTGATRGDPQLHTGEATGPDAIAVWNPWNGRSLIAGFVTQGRASSRFEIGEPKGDDEAGFYRFRAICEFDPPIVLEPGETLPSEVLYLSIGEQDPVLGLQRYARAAQVVNKTGQQPPPLVAWTTPVVANLDATLATAASLAPVGEIPFVLLGETAAPARALSDSELESAASAAAQAQSAGFQAALWTDPTRFAADHPLVQSRPLLFDDPTPGSPWRTLNFARPEAIAAAEMYSRRLAQAGINAIAGVDVNRLAEEVDFDGGEPTIATTEGMLAIRRGLDDGGRVYASSPSLLALTLTDGVVAPTSELSSAVSTASIAPSSIAFNGANDAAWRRAAAATFADTAVLFDADTASAWPDALDRMTTLLPIARSRAVPADIFANDPARVLHARHENAAGTAHTVAVFNWAAVAESTVLPLAVLADPPGTYYTVYDYWARRYLGTAVDRLNINVAPGDASVLVLRPHLPQPMPLLLGTNLGQSAPAITAYEWDARNARMRLAATGDAAFTLPILVPNELRLVESAATLGTVSVSSALADERVIDATFSPDEHGAAEASFQFRR